MKKDAAERPTGDNVMLSDLVKRKDPLSKKLLEYYKKNFGM